MSLDVHVVSHTHWDREWYHPVGRFRQRLVALVDELLDDPPTEGSFLLDGQAIVLEDYLAVRPERAGELAALLRAGRLEAGPWYVLGDELIPGAEAIVRNLLTGRRALAALRAQSPAVLYCPDSFGHPAALPELAAGFGLALIVLWRGYGGARWPAGDVVRWRAPSGATSLVHHLPRDGYEYGSHLPLDAEGAAERWARMRAELGERSALGVVLLPHGADHHARQRGWRDALRELTSAAAPDHAHPSALGAFAAALSAHAEGAALPEVAGELRDSYGFTWALQGTFASRAQQKRRNAHAERLLVREAEPWAALARRAGGTSRKPLVDAAWRALLQCHPHDTLCGCSTDEVARAMETRLDDATTQGRGLRDDAVLDLVGYDAVDARTRPREWRGVVLLRNAAARPRAGVAIVDVVSKLADDPVGPGSAHAPRGPRGAYVVGDALHGAPAQTLGMELGHERIESPRHYPDNDAVAVTRMAVWVGEVPAYGVASLRTGHAERAAIPAGAAVRGEGLAIEGGGLRLEALRGGVVRMTAGDGRVVEPFVTIEDVADGGDLYTPSPRGTSAVPRVEGASLEYSGPLRATLALRYVLDAVGMHEGEVSARLRIRLTLDAGAPFVRIAVEGENLAPDHRLRLVVGSGVRDAAVWADAAFGPVLRAPIVVPAEDAVAEIPPPTAPLHRYVTLYGDARGATLYSDGLAEYEALPDGRVAVTLVRAVGEISRNDLPERPGHAGWPVPTPEAQSLGPFAAAFALLPHGPRTADTIDRVERVADDVLLPLAGSTLRSAVNVHDARGVELMGRGLAFSCAKDAAEGDAMVLRCVNLLDEPVDGAWRVPFAPGEARLARLDETPLEMLDVDGETVRFLAGPRAVVTVLVR